MGAGAVHCWKWGGGWAGVSMCLLIAFPGRPCTNPAGFACLCGENPPTISFPPHQLAPAAGPDLPECRLEPAAMAAAQERALGRA